VWEWAPDIDAYLYDANGTEVFYSGCPAAGDNPLCFPDTPIAYGQLETLYIPTPTNGPYRLELFAVQDSINNGQGGDITYDISNHTTGGADPMMANAGENQIVTANKKGTARVTLDGSGSSGPIDSYSWSWSGGSASGPNPTVTLAEGPFFITLEVSDGSGTPQTSDDQVLITVDPKGTGGGGGGPGNGGGGNGGGGNGGGGNCGKKNKPPCPG
jgi:hypothetical protein